MERDTEGCCQAGADHIMPKPITTAEVAEMLLKMIARLEEDGNQAEDKWDHLIWQCNITHKWQGSVA